MGRPQAHKFTCLQEDMHIAPCIGLAVTLMEWYKGKENDTSIGYWHCHPLTGKQDSGHGFYPPSRVCAKDSFCTLVDRSDKQASFVSSPRHASGPV